MTTIKFENGQEMPLVGLGTWKAEPGVVGEAVSFCLKNGYKHIDTACDYGNEKEVGEGIKQAIESGAVKREDIFVTTKLWNTFHAKEHVNAAFERQLKDLGLEYVELFLIHFPIALDYVDPSVRYPPGWGEPGQKQVITITETWQAMEALVASGKVKNIGISNFSCSLTTEILKICKIKPVVNQIEIHPTLCQKTTVQWMQDQGIVVTGYSPFGSISYASLFESAAKCDNLLPQKCFKFIDTESRTKI